MVDSGRRKSVEWTLQSHAIRDHSDSHPTLTK